MTGRPTFRGVSFLLKKKFEKGVMVHVFFFFAALMSSPPTTLLFEPTSPVQLFLFYFTICPLVVQYFLCRAGGSFLHSATMLCLEIPISMRYKGSL